LGIRGGDKVSDYKVGQVTHYFDKIGVAIIELISPLASGDRIKFVKGNEDLFEQDVDSMQVEHQKITSAKSGDMVGLKVDREVSEGAEIFKVQ
jgi:U32 family peptidase